MLNLNENKSFCILPFVHLHVNEKNNIKLCCLADGEVVGKYTKDFDFKNDPAMQEIRSKILAGERIPHCKECYNYEDRGADSSRLRDTAEWVRKLNIEKVEDVPTELMYYDIRNDNLCNLSCRMCNPQFSSQLAKEYKMLGWIWTPEPKSFSFSEVVDLDTCKKIYVAGGEPSLMPEFRTFLKKAIDAGKTDIEIRMNTNATNLNKEYRDMLSQFSGLNIVCSIDGFDQINRYIRWPADWDTIVENVHGLRAITPNVAFNVTVSIWNIANLSKLVFFLEKEFPGGLILLNRVFHPPMQMFHTFPNKDLALADLELLKQSNHYAQDDSFRGKVDYFIAELVEAPLNLPALEEFFDYNDTLDESRGVELKDFIPELDACRAYLTKQT